MICAKSGVSALIRFWLRKLFEKSPVYKDLFCANAWCVLTHFVQNIVVMW